jgi:DNA-binding LytR/AlgR family response regulator
MSYRCLIVEDEPIARDIVKEYLDYLSSFEGVGECENAFEATEFLKDHPVDIIFLDIHLPKLSGLNFLKTLMKPPKVIITTAYQEYALEGFELDVSDYLLKPFSLERFMKAANKVAYELDLEHQQFSQPSANNDQQPGTASAKDLWVRFGNQLVKVPIEQILYLKAYGNYVKLVTAHSTYVAHQSLQQYASELEEQGFIRIHRSYVVPISKIEALEGNQVLIGGTKLPVGEQYKAALMRILG